MNLFHFCVKAFGQRTNGLKKFCLSKYALFDCFGFVVFFLLFSNIFVNEPLLDQSLSARVFMCMWLFRRVCVCFHF